MNSPLIINPNDRPEVPWSADYCPIITPYLLEDRDAACRSPYPNRPQGCPNYGRKFGCPPHADRFDHHFDTRYFVYLLWVKWEIGVWADWLGKLHPDWTERQRYCCLYWQNGVRRILKDYAREWVSREDEYVFNDNPEAMGLNVDAILRESADICLEWPPRKFVYKVGIAGVPQERKL